MNTPSSREAERNALAAQVAAFSGSIEVLPSFPERPTYQKRTSWIDPEAKRKPRKPFKSPSRLVHELTPEELAIRREKDRARRARNKAVAAQEWKA